MSVIQKQGVRHSLVNYFGVAVSFLSTIFIYNLDLELYGFAQFLTNAASFLIPFMTMGVMGLILKYFPEFRDPDQRTSFIKTLFRLFFLTTISFFVIYLIFSDYFIHVMKVARVDRQGILDDYFTYVVVLAFILGINRMLTIHSSNLRRIVFPEMINNLGYKIALPVFVLLGFYGLIDKSDVTWAIMAFFILVGVILFVYVRKWDGFKGKVISWRSIADEKRKEIKSFTFFSAMNGLSASFAFRIDMIMLSAMLGFASNGVYALLLFLSNVIDIPRKSLARIITPFLSKASKEGDIEETRKLYQKASLILIIPSLMITILIWICLPELDKIASGRPVFWDNRFLFLFLALGRLIDMLLSMNTEIISFSRYFRYNLFFILVLASVNVVLNYYFINEYQILGAAMATFVAFVLYNILKSAFLYWKMDIHPFHPNTWKVMSIAALSVAIVSFVPTTWSIWFSIPVKGILLLITYALPVYILQLAPELNQLLHRNLDKAREYIGW
jgi:O-antigen/teichoic acid export membrane protein